MNTCLVGCQRSRLAYRVAIAFQTVPSAGTGAGSCSASKTSRSARIDHMPPRSGYLLGVGAGLPIQRDGF